MRGEMQDHYMEILRRTFSALNMVTLYLAPHEIKGLARINEISQALFRDGA
jgi:anion-transporting  ArsA/GET3 family ATPase